MRLGLPGSTAVDMDDDLAKILDRLSGADPVAYRSFLLMLDLWDRQDGEQR